MEPEIRSPLVLVLTSGFVFALVLSVFFLLVLVAAGGAGEGLLVQEP